MEGTGIIPPMVMVIMVPMIDGPDMMEVGLDATLCYWTQRHANAGCMAGR
jgi:hypothetical protein